MLIKNIYRIIPGCALICAANLFSADMPFLQLSGTHQSPSFVASKAKYIPTIRPAQPLLSAEQISGSILNAFQAIHANNQLQHSMHAINQTTITKALALNSTPTTNNNSSACCRCTLCTCFVQCKAWRCCSQAGTHTQTPAITAAQ